MEIKQMDRDVKTTVLVVDDDRNLLEFLSVALRREGYRILVAGNGLEALDISNGGQNGCINILLSDVSMPYMGGIQLAECLRETQPDLRVLLISGLPLQEVRDRCGPTFLPNLLSKPFSVSDLTRGVRELTEAV